MASTKHGIPAASIRSVDLDAVAKRFPEQAREISPLNELMQRGEETEEEFRSLCELLHTVGETREAEYLLRRNLRCAAKDKELYQRLFGTSIPDDFERAVESFAEEFGLNITLREERDFLDREFVSIPLRGDHSRFNILNAKCLVRFDYSNRDFVVAQINASDSESVNYFNLNTCLFLRWQNQRWRLTDPRDV